MKKNDKVGAALIIGGGIGGIQAALDLADSGYKVYLVEAKPSIGGVMAQLDKTFPTNDCSMCILAPKLVAVARHPSIEIITNAELEEVSGEAGNFLVSVRKKPRYVDMNKCTGCGICMQNCPVRQVISVDGDGKEPVLSAEDSARARAILDECSGEKGAIMSVLQAINKEYNYLPVHLLHYVARELNIPLSQVYSIATFYNAFSLEPRGRHTIALCRGTACHVRGASLLLDRLTCEFGIADGDTTGDLRFTLHSVRCIGCCSIAPAVRIDKDTYGHVRPDKIMDMLKRYQ